MTVPTGSLDGVRLIDPRPEAPSPPRPVADPGPLDCRVLIVDDHDEVRHLMWCLLEDAGCDVVSARDGYQALEAVRESESSGRPIDVVLMDMQTPVIDGYETTARLLADGYRSPIIALTAHALRDDREKCIEAGCADYISKPVNYERLLDTIARHTGRGSRGSAAPPPEPAGAASSGGSGIAERSDGCRVLLVDDDPDLRRLLSLLLGARGHEVRTEGTGLEALEAAADFRPQVVVLDLGLPDISGREVVRRLRRLGGLEDSVFIAHSGRDAEPEDRRRGSEPLFDHHVVKPVDVAQLERLFPRSGLSPA